MKLPNFSFIKSIGILIFIVFPLLFLFSHHDKAAHADASMNVMVTVPNLNVRESAGIQSAIISQVHQGDLFKVLDTENDWDQITLSNNQTGWVSDQYVKKVDTDTQVIIASKVSGLNVHESADLSSKIISHISSPGKWYPELDIQGDLIEINTPDGTGWVTSKLVNERLQPKYHQEDIGATVAANVLNIRQNPDATSGIVGELKKDTHITIYDEQSGWAKIVTSQGIEGWVSESYINMDSEKENLDQNGGASTNQAASESNSQNSTSTSSITDRSANDVKNSDENQRPPMKMESMKESSTALEGKTIVLDPGHGGQDNGTTGVTGVHEKDLTLETAKLVEQKLEAAGAHVVMTRTDDSYPTLQDRVDDSENSHADAFISFHYNSSPLPFVKGVTDFYYNKGKDGVLASDILNEVAKMTGLENRGCRFDNLYVLRNNSEPATLIELGFLSNRQEATTVESSTYQNQAAQAVYTGLLDYFSQQ